MEVPLSYGRSMLVLQSPCYTCARFRFEELFGTAMSNEDFAALTARFNFIQVSNVPRLRGENNCEASRWIWFIDHCYEQRTCLNFTSHADGPEDLIDLQEVATRGAGTGRSLQEVAFAASRTISRMYEMQSAAFEDAALGMQVSSHVKQEGCPTTAQSI